MKVLASAPVMSAPTGSYSSSGSNVYTVAAPGSNITSTASVDAARANAFFRSSAVAYYVATSLVVVGLGPLREN